MQELVLIFLIVIIIVFKSGKDPLTKDLYNYIRNDLVSVYGESINIRNFKSPYEKDDGLKIQP